MGTDPDTLPLRWARQRQRTVGTGPDTLPLSQPAPGWSSRPFRCAWAEGPGQAPGRGPGMWRVCALRLIREPQSPPCVFLPSGRLASRNLMLSDRRGSLASQTPQHLGTAQVGGRLRVPVQTAVVAVLKNRTLCLPQGLGRSQSPPLGRDDGGLGRARDLTAPRPLSPGTWRRLPVRPICLFADPSDAGSSSFFM